MLDKETIDRLIAALKVAKSAGFESLSSPVDLVLDACIDFSLELSDLLDQGAQERQANPSLKFLEKAKADALGNTRSVRIFKSRQWYYDPEAAEFIRNFASFLVAIKNREPYIKAFMAFKELIPLMETPENKPQDNQKERTKAQKAYLRRQIRRKTTHRNHKSD